MMPCHYYENKNVAHRGGNVARCLQSLAKKMRGTGGKCGKSAYIGIGKRSCTDTTGIVARDILEECGWMGYFLRLRQ